MVVESGDHHVTILDGDRFEPITRFPSRFALHGGPKFSPGRPLRLLRLARRLDHQVRSLEPEVVAEVRAGINTRNAAISDDGTVIAVANYLPHSLVLLDADDLAPLEVIPARDAARQDRARG